MNEQQKQESPHINPHALNKALERMRRGKSPRFFSANPEFQTALRLHIHTSDTEVDPQYKQRLQQRLLKQFAPAYVKEQPQSAWGRIQQWLRTPWVATVVSVGGVALVVLVIAQLLPSQPSFNTEQSNAEIAQEQGQQSNTNAPTLIAPTQQAGESQEQPNESSNTNETAEEQQPGTSQTPAPDTNTNATPAPSAQPNTTTTPDSGSLNTEIAGANQTLTDVESLSNELAVALDQIEQQEAELAAMDEFVTSSQSDTSTLLSSISSL